MAEDKNEAGRLSGEYMIQDRDHEVGQAGGERGRRLSRQSEQSQGDSRQQGGHQGDGGQQGGVKNRKDAR